jgi:hypothetical protein
MEVAAWKRSGETAREYARTRGISAATLTWWSSRGGAQGASVAATTPIVSREMTGGHALGGERGFLPVQVVTRVEELPRVEAEIVLAGGRRVRVAGALTLGQLAQLLEAVEGGRAC